MYGKWRVPVGGNVGDDDDDGDEYPAVEEDEVPPIIEGTEQAGAESGPKKEKVLKLISEGAAARSVGDGIPRG